MTVLFALLTLATQQAPRDTARLEEIVVTATRVPVSRAAVSSSVTVIRGETLRAGGVRALADALREVPGAALAQNGSFGSVASLFLRGGESDYVLVLVDGVPLNSVGGSFDFGSLTTDNVDRIEIVAGPASVLYGSDAVSGVVQVFTREGRGPATVEGGIRGGSYGTWAWDGGVRGSGAGLDYSASVSRFSTDGLQPNNGHHRAVASGRFRVAPDAATTATLVIRHSDGEYHFPTDGAGRIVDQNQFTFQGGTTLGLDFARRLADRVEARLLLGSHQTDAGFDDQPDSPADTLGFYASQSLNHGSRRSGEVQLNASLGGAIVTAGGKLEAQSERGVDRSSSQFGPFSGSSDFSRRNGAAYLQVLAEPAGNVSLTAGGRWDRNETFGTFLTYRAGVTVRPLPGTRLRASAGTGFKEPTFFENFATGFTRGNPDLEPERSASREVGVEQDLAAGRVTVSATWFAQRFRDLIQYNPLPVGLSAPNYFNIAAADARGLETSVRVGLPGGEVVASYTWLRTRVRDAGFDTGPDATFVADSALLRRPEHSLALRGTVGLAGRGSVTAALRHVGRRVDRDFARFPAPRVWLPAYTVGDVAGELMLLSGGPRAWVTVGVENVADQQYQEILNFPARGRTVMLGGRFSI